MIPLLSEKEAAAVLNVKPRTLQAWRLAGKGPAHVSLGKLVRYRRETIDAYAREREEWTPAQPMEQTAAEG